MEFIEIPGEDRGKVVLYTISTCMWCKKTKRLLNELGVKYSYIDVDSLQGEEKEKVKKEVLKWKSTASYPLLVIDDKHSIPYYDEEDIKKELGFE